MKNLIISLVLLLAAFNYSQIENEDKFKAFNEKERFFLDVMNFVSEEEGKTRADIFIQIPYTEIQFIKKLDGFEAKYSITLSVFGDNKNMLIAEKTFNESITSKEFEQTVSKNNFNLNLRSFLLIPGSYVLRAEVIDKDSRKSNVREIPFTVRDLSAPVSVSDIMIIAKQTAVEGNKKIVPNVSRNVSVQKEGVPLFFEIYSEKDTVFQVEYFIQDLKGENIISDSKETEVAKGRNQIFHTVEANDLGLGSYRIAVLLKSNGNVSTTISKIFQSRLLGIPAAIKDLDKAISQLRYIATGSELDFIEDARDSEEKIKRYMDFWKKKDPTPNTEDNQLFEEYYKRVDYANKNFSHYVEGWKTDRGMVFIILGAPSNVERHPFEYNSKPYEVWEYYQLNKQFVFLDETGFGDYRLVTPLYGDFTRFR